MSLILNIDTAINNGAVGLSENGRIIAQCTSADQKEHASFLQPAIQQIMLEVGKGLNEIEAVSVTIGPGSYTGLRVGLASAKGLCYALKKPLIAINTLKVIALAAIETAQMENVSLDNAIICPMIDARRMEVFTALYTPKLEIALSPIAMVLDENSFQFELETSRIIFSGNGVFKFDEICRHSNAIFLKNHHDISHLATLATVAFSKNELADIAYLEPFYAKGFYTTQVIKK